MDHCDIIDLGVDVGAIHSHGEYRQLWKRIGQGPGLSLVEPCRQKSPQNPLPWSERDGVGDEKDIRCDGRKGILLTQ
jgi:hypothetical protein